MQAGKQFFFPFTIFFVFSSAVLFSQNSDSTLHNGYWTDPAIWSKGVTPSDTDFVYIKNHVILDTDVTMISPGMVYITGNGALCGDHDFSGSFINYGPLQVRNITVTDTSYSYAHWMISNSATVLVGADWTTYSPGYGCVGCPFTCNPVIPPIADFNSNTTICAGKTIQFSDLSTNSPTSWSWFFPGGSPSISPQKNPAITYNQAGVFDVTLVASNSIGSDTITKLYYINVLPAPVLLHTNDTTINYGNTVTLIASGGGGYLWSTGDTTSSIFAQPSQTTIYTITATNSYGCTTADNITVNIEPCNLFFLPNAFSPNGDGENDSLKIYYRNSDCIENLHLIIYDRWGEKVYTTDDKYFRWGGNQESGEQHTKVFAYNLYVKFTDGKEMNRRGNITLLR